MRVSRDGYRGCPQINVAAEFADPEHPARKIRRRHKVAMRERLRDIVGRIGVTRPDDTSDQLALLIDGAFTSDGRLSKSNAVRILQNGADALLRDASSKKAYHELPATGGAAENARL
jgi:hypothetical protein